ncbi:hypothetical protein [Variovorax paradoxus]|jgi:hypothetical protein|uniref:hypothetical protein n=1 Tax=Variovorax paradoxus TaxID=34073 RepID=UPI0030CD8F5A
MSPSWMFPVEAADTSAEAGCLKNHPLKCWTVTSSKTGKEVGSGIEPAELRRVPKQR